MTCPNCTANDLPDLPALSGDGGPCPLCFGSRVVSCCEVGASSEPFLPDDPHIAAVDVANVAVTEEDDGEAD